MPTFRRVWLIALASLWLAAPGWTHGGETGGPSATVLKRLFPAAESFVTRPLQLDAGTQKRVAGRLGQPLEAHDLKSSAYIPVAKGQSLGVVWATDAHLKEGLVDVIVGVDRQGKVVGVALEHSPVAALAQSAYLNQFKGQTISPRLKQARALSSHAAASGRVARAVFKCAVVIDEAYLGGSKP